MLWCKGLSTRRAGRGSGQRKLGRLASSAVCKVAGSAAQCASHGKLDGLSIDAFAGSGSDVDGADASRTLRIGIPFGNGS